MFVPGSLGSTAHIAQTLGPAGCVTWPSPTHPSVNTATAPTTPSPSVLTTPSKIEPMKAFDSRFTERSKATPGTPSLANVTPTAVER